jgi:hypothetical protein
MSSPLRRLLDPVKRRHPALYWPTRNAGALHVNDQPAEYWIRRFAERGFPLLAHDGGLRAAVAAPDLPPWSAANVHAFSRGDA